MGQYLCGFEDWLVNLIANPRFAGALLDRVVELESQMVRNILRAVGECVDVVLCPDDLGMQTAPLIAPALYRKMIKPRHRRLFDAIKGGTRAKLLLHSDGAIAPLIGDLVDVGVDALNPVQVSAAGMGDTKRLKREFGNRIAFWGAIDTHRVLPFGSPQEVREEVRRRIETLAPGGGYVLASVHNLQAEVPPENVCAMFEEAKRHGDVRSRPGNV
jgi:uroporphyrinogen decarboxylase